MTTRKHERADLNILLGHEPFILACQKSWRRPTKRALRRIMEKRGKGNG